MSANFEKKILAQVSGKKAWKHVEFLSNIDKTSGTEGEVKAHEYIRQQLSEFNVPFNAYEFSSLISHPLDASLRVLSENKNIECRPAAFGAKTSGIEGELMFVELPSDTLFGGVEEVLRLYKKAGVKGKIPIVWGLAAPTVMWAAQEAGALAQIHISGEEAIHEMIVTTIWGTPTPESAERLPKIPALSIRRSDGEYLLKIIRNGSVKVKLTSNVDTKWRKIPITVANIEAKASPDKFMLVHGHMDSWYYGTTDNCTGNAACLELSRVFSKNRSGMKRSLRVAWWSGHSTGRYSGSTWYADYHYDELSKNCFASLNIDSPGVKGASEVSGGGLMGTTKLITNVIKDSTGIEKFAIGVRYSRAGDQSFYGIGIPSVGASGHLPKGSPDAGVWTGGGGGGWWWHNPADTVDKGDKSNLERDIRMEALAITRLINPPIIPFDITEAMENFDKAFTDLSNKAPKSREVLKKTRDKISKIKTLSETLMKNSTLKRVKKSNLLKFNESIIKMTHILTSIQYTYSGYYDQDPAYNMGQIPQLRPMLQLENLDDDDFSFGFWSTRLIRNVNYLNDKLEELHVTMENALKMFV